MRANRVSTVAVLIAIAGAWALVTPAGAATPVPILNAGFETNGLTSSSDFKPAPATPIPNWTPTSTGVGMIGEDRASVNDDLEGTDIAWLHLQGTGAAVGQAIGAVTDAVFANPAETLLEVTLTATRRLNENNAIDYTLHLYASSGASWTGGTLLSSASVSTSLVNRTEGDPGSYVMPTASLFLDNAAAQTAGGSYWLVVESNVGGQLHVDDISAQTVADPLGGTAPVFLAQPQDATVLLGVTNATVVFSVTAEGQLPLSYQWRMDGTNISQATETSLTITNVASADLGTYDVVVTNPIGGASSLAATLTYVTAPVEPAARINVAGTVAAFSLAMPVGPAYTYQWALNGTNLTGAIDPDLVIPVVQFADDGDYTVTVTLGPDEATSDPAAALTVVSPATQPYADTVTNDGPVAYWRLGEAAGAGIVSDEIAPLYEGAYIGEVQLGRTGAIEGDADTAAGFSRASVNRVEIPFDAGYNSTIFSVELWAQVTGGSGQTRFAGSTRDVFGGIWQGWAVDASSNNRWTFHAGQGFAGIEETVIEGPPVEENAWAHLVGIYDGADLSFYVNGILAGTVTNVPYEPLESAAGLPCFIGAGFDGTVESFFFDGNVDDVSIYDYALNEAAIVQHFKAAVDLSAPPVVSVQPEDQVVRVGDAVTIDVGVSSSTLVTYQWRLDGTPLSGQTNQTLVLSSVVAGDAGMYDLVVSNGAGTDTSDAAQLVVLLDFFGTFVHEVGDLKATTVLTRDGSSDWWVDDNQQLGRDTGRWNQRSVFGIPGRSDFGYEGNQGFSGPLDIELRTTLSGLEPGVDYAVWVLYGTVASSTVNRDILAGFDGEEVTRFTLQNSTDTGVQDTANWDVMQAFLGIRAADGLGEIKTLVDHTNGTDRAVFYGVSYQVANPNPAPPTISIPPASIATLIGETGSVSVLAGSLEPVTYQWQFGGVDVTNATNDTYTIEGIQKADAGEYRVLVSNTQGTTTSEVADVVVLLSYAEGFTLPDGSNTILTRNGSAVWSDTNQEDAVSNGLWWASADYAVSNIAGSSHGYFAGAAQVATGDVEIQTTLTGLTPGETYAVWLLYSYETNSTWSRIGAALEGNPVATWDNITGTAIGDAPEAGGNWEVFMGFLGTRVADGAGTVRAIVDFKGLVNSVYNGIGVQLAVLPGLVPMDIDLVGGNVVVTWPDGVLQQTDDLPSDSWNDVPGATSPHTVTSPLPVESFRLREP